MPSLFLGAWLPLLAVLLRHESHGGQDAGLGVRGSGGFRGVRGLGGFRGVRDLGGFTSRGRRTGAASKANVNRQKVHKRGWEVKHQQQQFILSIGMITCSNNSSG